MRGIPAGGGQQKSAGFHRRPSGKLRRGQSPAGKAGVRPECGRPAESLGMLLQEFLAENKTPKWLKAICAVISVIIMIYAIIEYFFTADRLLNLSEIGSELMCVLWSVALIIALRDVVILDDRFMLKIIISFITKFVN